VNTPQWKQYDSIATQYDADFAVSLIAPARELVQRTVPEQQPVRVLDLGAGTGLASAMANERACTGSAIIGIDLSLPMLRIARDQARCHPVVGDGIALPFADHSLDIVIANFVLSHCAEIHVVLNEIARVLAPGGSFGATAWGGAESVLRTDWMRVAQCYIAKEQLEEARDAIVPAEVIVSNPDALKKAFGDAGLERTAVTSTSYTRSVTLAEFMASKELAGLGRFARHHLDPETYQRFQEQLTTELSERHPNRMTETDEVHTVIGFKPDSRDQRHS
jgi:ubiquinone/menaquinone biosynthesis C-methylase UbiE